MTAAADHVQPVSGRVPAPLVTSEIARWACSPARSVQAGGVIYLEGDPARFVYQVVEGAVRRHRTTADGRRQLVGFGLPGEWLGVGTGPTYAHTAEAIAPSRLSPLSRADMLRRMSEDRDFLADMLDATARQLRRAEDQMVLLGQGSAVERVAAFLHSVAIPLSGPDGEIHLPMDRSDIADFLGLTVETVSRKLTLLKSMGVIALITPSRLVIKNEPALRATAEGGAYGGRAAFGTSAAA
jgi:CRP-like cAMP-binding protein